MLLNLPSVDTGALVVTGDPSAVQNPHVNGHLNFNTFSYFGALQCRFSCVHCLGTLSLHSTTPGFVGPGFGVVAGFWQTLQVNGHWNDNFFLYFGDSQNLAYFLHVEAGDLSLVASTPKIIFIIIKFTIM